MRKWLAAVLSAVIILNTTGCARIEDKPPPATSGIFSEDTATAPPFTEPPPESTSAPITAFEITSEAVTEQPMSQPAEIVSQAESEETQPSETMPDIKSAPLTTDDPAPNGRVIYLTFDDGPGRHTERLLDILDKYDVKATFFVINTSHTYLIAEEFKRGHSVGIHCNTHDYRTIYKNEDAYFDDLEEMQSVILEQTGKRTSLLRFPGGSSNTVSCFNKGIMTRLTEAVENKGYTYFDWNVSSGDAGRTTETSQVVENVISGIKKRDVSVVLQHDPKSFSVDAVEEIILWGLENGYTFLPLTSDSPTCHHGVVN